MPDTIDYHDLDIPAPGAVAEIAPGVHWLRMPLPFRLNHINLWLLEDGDGWTIVDTGIFDDRTVELWEGVFAGLLAGRPVNRVICTHFHPDHAGMAGWLCERFGVRLWMTQAEWLSARSLSTDTDPDVLDHQAEFLRAAGCSDQLVADTRQGGLRYPRLVSPVPRSYRRMRDGMAFEVGGREWRVVVGTGHAPEHACLYCESLSLMIAGDQVLPRITPIVAVQAFEPEANPLADFLMSVGKLRNLPADTYVLPSHDRPFAGLHARLDYLHAHHVERLEEFQKFCDTPRTAAELAALAFPRAMDGQNITFALGETLAHLNFLVIGGQMGRTTRPDGIHLYAPVTG
jgi:glyoxylase-like metal-dependent hydrolase (beta-lactamase superfamily II)